jgi:hypothetical protein
MSLLFWWLMSSPYATPEAALADFYRGVPGPECMVDQPLRRDGRRVVPLVVQEVSNRAMPRRRYAIAFLGYGRHAEALPTLEKILADRTEIDHFRADALLAIYQIAPTRAQTSASGMHDSGGLLGLVVEAFGQGDAAIRVFIGRSC